MMSDYKRLLLSAIGVICTLVALFDFGIIIYLMAFAEVRSSLWMTLVGILWIVANLATAVLGILLISRRLKKWMLWLIIPTIISGLFFIFFGKQILFNPSAMMRRGDVRGAIEFHERAAAREGPGSEEYEMLGYYYYASGEYEKAFDNFKRYDRKPPNYKQLILAALHAEKFDAALSLSDDFISHSNNEILFSQAMGLKASTYLRKKEYAQAAEVYEQLASKLPSFKYFKPEDLYSINSEIGNCYARLGNNAKALEAYQKDVLLWSLKKATLEPWAYVHLGDFYLYKASLDEALKYYTLALEGQKGSIVDFALLGRAAALTRKGDYEGALKDLSHHFLSDRESWDAEMLKVSILQRKGDPKAAEKARKQAQDIQKKMMTDAIMFFEFDASRIGPFPSLFESSEDRLK